MHQTSFGHVFVVPTTDEQYIAFAVGGQWPHKILQVDRMDRKIGQSTELDVNVGSLFLLDLEGVINCYKSIRDS